MFLIPVLSNMEPAKPLFLKTYGKQRRKLSAWISPDNRKQVFDSSVSTGGDDSVFEPAKPTRPRGKTASVTDRRGARLAKTKATSCLKEKTLLPSSPEAPRQSKTTRGRKPGGAGGTAQPAKRKAASSLSESGSDEENTGRASPPCPRPPGPRPPGPRPPLQSNAARRSRITSAPAVSTQQKRKQAPVICESEEDSRVHPRSVGRFVTRRRRRADTKPKVQAAIARLLDSSDDFTTGAPRSKATGRRTRGKTIPAARPLSSAENSANAPGTLAFDPLREVSLNESADRSLAPRPGKLIFCSTPSAGAFGRRPHLKHLPVADQSPSPPPLSVSSAGLLSPFQGSEDSPGRPLSTPSEERLRETHPHREPSADLFEGHAGTSWRTSGRPKARGNSEDSKAESGAEPSGCSKRLAAVHSDDSAEFMSTDGGLEWLTEALKEQCLTRLCTVQLERWDILATSPLCGQTTYSSCLGLSADEHPTSSAAPSFRLRVSASRNESGDLSRSVDGSESPGQAAAVESTRGCERTCDTERGDCFVLDSRSTSSGPPSARADRRAPRRRSVRLEALSLERKQREPSLICIRSPVSVAATESDADSAAVSDPQPLSSDPEAEGNAAAAAGPREKCLSDNVGVETKKLTSSQLRVIKRKSPAVVSELVFDEQVQSEVKCERDPRLRREDASLKASGPKNHGSTSSEDRTSSDREVAKGPRDVRPKKGRTSVAPREGKRRSASADRPGTTRKVCVSGLSTNRWKGKNGSFGARIRAGDARSVDCSINELISTRHKEPRGRRSVMKFSTPVRGSPLSVSALLAQLTPNTLSWSRLKAAHSVHRKVVLTPSSFHPWGTPARTNPTDLSQDLFATPFRTSFPRHLQSQYLDDTLGLREEADLSDAEKVYAECGQKRPLPWEECIPPHRMRRCAKIGEGTFGEVFSTTNASGDTVALKIIPVEGSEEVNGEAQKTFGEILHEIIISKELSSLKEKKENQTHSFIGLNDLHCVRGCYPPAFMTAWDKFDQQKGSENDRPDFFESDQLFLILEFEFGGVDLENSDGKLASLGVAKSILHQVTAAMAVAEQELRFEHRDLHWGNILVKTTKQKTGSFLLNGTSHSLETAGVLVRIIDYSLSRLEIDDLTVSCDISNDEELFMGQGDYQFEIYRLMRRENGNNWSDFHPHSNVLWLHYLCSKLLSMKYRYAGRRGAKDTREELTRFHDNVLQYSSATDALQNCPMFQ